VDFDQVQHSRRRPYDPDGKKRPWRYYSSAAVTATFTDFSAIAPLVAQLADVESATVGHLHWWLTRKATLKRTARVRDEAVLDALAKAKGYTTSLGCNTFHAVAIADPGMLSISTEHQRESVMAAPPAAARGLAAGAGGDDERLPSLRPERISISASVEARFEASSS
jgi:predicted secreted protein